VDGKRTQFLSVLYMCMVGMVSQPVRSHIG